MNEEQQFVPLVPSVEPYNIPSEIKERKTQLKKSTDIDQDFEYIKGNLKDLVETGSSALTSLFDLAQQSDNARAFEVLANSIKILAEVNKDLLDIHERRVKIENEINKGKTEEPQGNTTNIQNNVVFTGTTASLNEIVEKLQRSQIPHINNKN